MNIITRRIAKSTREWIDKAETRISNGEDYVDPIRLIQLARAILEDLEDIEVSK